MVNQLTEKFITRERERERGRIVDTNKLTPNITPFNNVLIDVNFIKFIVRLKIYII
jgi:hypothetical protein